MWYVELNAGGKQDIESYDSLDKATDAFKSGRKLLSQIVDKAPHLSVSATLTYSKDADSDSEVIASFSRGE